MGTVGAIVDAVVSVSVAAIMDVLNAVATAAATMTIVMMSTIATKSTTVITRQNRRQSRDVVIVDAARFRDEAESQGGAIVRLKFDSPASDVITPGSEIC